MLGLLNLNNIGQLLISVPITLVALTGHEFAHAWVSSKLGDPTPKLEGRLTLNPFAHLDLVGTILMVLTGFGWAKPVGVNPMYYKDRKKGMALVAASGPIANLIMAVLSTVLLAIVFVLMNKSILGGAVASSIITILNLFIMRNLMFMVFNLIPLPPLDGWKVVGMFLPNRIYYTILQYEQYAMFLIMALSFLGVLNSVLSVGYGTIYNLLINFGDVLINLMQSIF